LRYDRKTGRQTELDPAELEEEEEEGNEDTDTNSEMFNNIMEN